MEETSHFRVVTITEYRIGGRFFVSFCLGAFGTLLWRNPPDDGILIQIGGNDSDEGDCVRLKIQKKPLL